MNVVSGCRLPPPLGVLEQRAYIHIKPISANAVAIALALGDHPDPFSPPACADDAPLAGERPDIAATLR